MSPQNEATARLEARFACERGKTRLRHLFASAPLKIAKTFELEDGLGVCVMDCSPGMLAGDFYAFDWHLQADSRAQITTQGFTRVHPSRERPCRLEQRITLENGALLEWFPCPTILFGDAALGARCEVEMAESATLLHGEILGAGRIGRGEAFEFYEMRNRIRVRHDGRLIFCNQTALRPQNFDPKRRGAWDGYSHQGNLLIFAPRAGEGLVEILRVVLDENAAIWGGVSALERGGVAVSLLGQRACDLQGAMAQLRGATRDFLGNPAP